MSHHNFSMPHPSNFPCTATVLGSNMPYLISVLLLWSLPEEVKKPLLHGSSVFNSIYR